MKIPFHDFGGDGPILHFAHSNGYPPACFRQMIEPLTRYYHVLGVYHRPLWPDTNPEELTDWRQIADDLIQFFEQEGLQNVIGVGHSLGAVATMFAAVKRPELFRALVLIEPVFLLPTVLEMVKANPALGESLPLVQSARRRRTRWQNRQEAFDRFRRKKVFRRWSDEALWDYVNNTVAETADGAVLIYRPEWEARFYTLPPFGVWEALPQVTQPTLAIRGTETDTLFPEAWTLWQECQPGAMFVEIEEAGHMVPMERPLQVSETILSWLKKQEKTSE